MQLGAAPPREPRRAGDAGGGHRRSTAVVPTGDVGALADALDELVGSDDRRASMAAAPPPTSGRQAASEVTTGHPRAIASMIGSPNPA